MTSSAALASIKAPAAALRAPATVRRGHGRVTVAPIRAVSTAAEGSKLGAIVAEIASAADPTERVKKLVGMSASLPELPDADRSIANRVMGCTAEAWVDVSLDAEGLVAVRGASEAQITAGFAGVLARGLTGLTPADVLAVSDDVVADLGIGSAALPRSRANGFRNMLETVKKQCRLLTAEDGVTAPPFPSLIVTADGVEAKGSFALAQAEYLEPDAAAVDALVAELAAKKIGIVAHFYMDPQVQGVLMAAAKKYEHIFISDSLVMADAAVRMVNEGGCESIAVLGVDFMSENVRAILDDAGLESAKVYRMAAEDIGCSLAEAAQDKKYYDYLAEADGVENAVHVIYINTALDTKANANAAVPTITCTSSNVVQTVLTAAAQIPGVNVFYGPDTYMGGNLAELFTMMSTWSDEDVAAVHPAHTQKTIKELLPRLRYFQDGTCMVHHMFGGDVCENVKKYYGDAYQTAHFEVPGEMFKLAMEAKRERDMGVVGSTKNILDYVCDKIDEAVERNLPAGERLSFVLGTETGMVTSIVRAAQAKLRAAKESGAGGVEAEIVFPVSADAVTSVGEADSAALGGLTIVPGPAGGEGCSAEGGCASCPYMKMNSLDALMSVCRKVGTEAGAAFLAPYEPRKYESAAEGPSVAALGCVPILHMRDFQRDGKFSDAFVEDITTRGGKK